MAWHSTVGIIWQEIGVRIHQEGKSTLRAIREVLAEGSTYYKELKNRVRDLEFIIQNDELIKIIFSDIKDFTKEVMQTIQDNLNEKIKTIMTSF